MRKNKLTRFAAWLAFTSLVLSLCAGIVVSDNAKAQGRPDKPTRASSPTKVSADLAEKVKGPKAATERVSVIIQLSGPMSGQLNGLLNSNGVHIKGSFKKLQMLAVELPASVVSQLQQHEGPYVGS